MKILGRRREPAPATPDLVVGRCPACDGAGGNGPLADCITCQTTGKVLYRPSWSVTEDVRLRELIGEGRPERYAAIVLRRPLATVHVRMAELHLASSRPEPDSPVHVRIRGGGAVNIHDPAGFGGGP